MVMMSGVRRSYYALGSCLFYIRIKRAWADAFRSSPDLTGVVHIYEELKRKGIEFPMADLDALSPIHTPQRIARLRSELDIVRGNTKVMSEMLTEMVPGQEDSSDLELLQFLFNILVLTFGLEAFQEFERYRSGRSTQNASNGVLNEVTEDNLIDLGPGSPAVVSPMVGNSAPPSSLSSQLAGLDLGTNSVSGTLSSLQHCNPNPRDDFDMFAQTRGSSLAEQRKNVTYEDPQAVKGLASALDVRKQNTGGIPVAQSSVMDDIEEWLSTDLKGDELEEGVTSEGKQRCPWL
ncbi:tom1-like protein 2 isoform x1 [Limosa lapponica baueri]|uniref:Tom1-like protein 2 isoform x1 n=1 Tax=Limosa lapponica baueri TaxID=1758121 RepID=A0A2I0TSW8_LIMLA|nr:tom1-like protein 2 isoform x1 [Limosa lapponica baueri]